MQGALQRKAVTAVSIAAALIASAALAAVLAAYAAGDVAAREALFLSAAIVAASAAAGIAIVRLVLRRYVEPLAAVIDSLRGTLAGDRPLLAEPSSTHLRALTREVGRATGHLFREIELLRKERDQMRSILESMVEGVVLLDADMRVRSANRAAEAIFDVSGRDLEGKTLLEAFRSAELADIAETVAKGAASDEADLTLYRESIRHLRVNAVSLPAERDSTGGVLLVLSDITRMKRLEQMRRDFVSNVSHELKTPVTSIKGFVETLLDGATDDPERSAHFLRIILKQTDRIHDIIEDLLHLARLEQNDAPIAYSRANAGEIVRSAVEACRPAAVEKRITIRERNSESVELSCSPRLIEQALINLIDNAVKYSPESTTVEIEVRVESGWVLISVSDQGQGIPERDLPRIFERFYRIDRARTREIGGTGLGLAIVKHIALAHNGSVEVKSTLGGGSTFVLRLPENGGQPANRRDSSQ